MPSCSMFPPVKTGSGQSLCHGLMRYGAQNPPMTRTYGPPPAPAADRQQIRTCECRDAYFPNSPRLAILMCALALRYSTQNIHLLFFPLSRVFEVCRERWHEISCQCFPVQGLLLHSKYKIWHRVHPSLLPLGQRSVRTQLACRKIGTVRLIIP